MRTRLEMGSWVFALLLVGCFVADRSAGQGIEGDRSPVDLVVGPKSSGASWIVTVNQTSDSVSLVDIVSGKVLDEQRVGEYPTGIVLHPSLERVYVTGSYSGTIHAFGVSEGKLVSEGVWKLGGQPTGLAITGDGERLMVALTDSDEVVELGSFSGEVLRRIPVGRWPRSLALSKDGRRMVVGTSGDRGISVVDLDAGKMVHLDRFVGLNIGHMQLSSDGEHVYFPWMVYRRNAINEGNIRLGWVMASRLGRIGFGDDARREAISLDPPRQAVADPHGICLTSDDSCLVISASGTHELLVFKMPGLPFQDRGSTDHLPSELIPSPRSDRDVSEDRFYRIDIGGRPMGIRMSEDNRTVFVANYLDNSVQIVDIQQRKTVRRIELGSAPEVTEVRRGEAIFYDAQRSLDQWYSCHSCHYLGGSNSVSIDTMNDGSAYTFKTVLPLYELDQSGPWTWHGWQGDYLEAMKHSLRTTMLGPIPSDDDARAVGAFLAGLKAPPQIASVDSTVDRTPLEESARRGKEIFNGSKGGCADCHIGTGMQDAKIHDLGLGASGDEYAGFNTPSLRRVSSKVLYLHDGRYDTLEEVLRGDHAPHRVRGEELSDEEIGYLVAYLRTL